MKNWLQKFKLPTPVFVILAIGALASAAFLYLWLALAFFLPVGTLPESTDRYYLNEKYDDGDPLMTKNPDLSDILAGPVISAADPGLGNANAEIIIVEFADFTCNYCFHQEAAIRQIVEKYQGQVRLVWKDYPDRDKNSISYQAAMAARCAARQGKFWPYHDRLFALAGLVKADALNILAEDLKLDITSFIECRDRSETGQLVDDNIAEADALAIQGVPFIYINDQEIMGEVSVDELEQLIILAIDKN
ncbi:MAG: thioredoxin domain-containing protein [Planctomycetes bacterium]|jgi:predicted DsbA family dithiol-disulfide isomerase|nr:thioredoxin domain-containing protein [Planctomycetota bacterium]